MKTETILNGANKLVWDIIWYGFFILLVVVITTKPAVFLQPSYYTYGYLDPQIEIPENTIELPNNHRIVNFYNKIVPRVEFLRYILILWFLYMIIKEKRFWILEHLSPSKRKGWQKAINFFERYKKWI